VRGYQGQGGAAGRSKQEWLEHMCLSVCAHVLCCCLCAHAQGPDWANLDLQLADELHAISKQDREAGQGGVGGEGFGQGCELDRFVVEAPSAYLDTRFGALEESALVGEGGAKGQEDGEELAYSQADRSGLSVTFSRARARSLAREAPVLSYYQCGVAVAHSCACGALARVCARAHTHTHECARKTGIMLHYDTNESPTVLDVGSEIPPGVVRFLVRPHLSAHSRICVCIRAYVGSCHHIRRRVCMLYMRTCAHARTSICKRRYFANPSCSQRPIKLGAYKCIRAYQCIRLLPLPAQTGEHNEWRLAQSRQTLGTNWGVGSCRRQVVGRNVQQWHRGSRSWVSGESYVRVHVCCIYVCNRNMYVHTNLCMCA